ncbi:hypothetical protein ABZ778_29560 [Streptomyces bacillaris]|uniref:RapZ C-terminal domain-containing protein n=1 Tax=Streptomyces bacillaris TaxID=68179 RepID=UPI00345FAD93
MTTIRILSFAYGRAPAPTADLTIDLRALLRNPAADPELRQFTGLDQPVYDHVMNTPGAEWLAVHAVATARGLARETGAPAPRTDPRPEDGDDLLLVDLDGGRGGPLPDNPR